MWGRRTGTVLRLFLYAQESPPCQAATGILKPTKMTSPISTAPRSRDPIFLLPVCSMQFWTLYSLPSLEAKIWYGGLESVNPEFVHVYSLHRSVRPPFLSQKARSCSIFRIEPLLLPIYAPKFLGVYHPRRLLLTTPSYTFNARFTPPDVIERSRYPDPTGRAN